MEPAADIEQAASGRRRCEECGRSFRALRRNQVYCSERHRRTALMRRKRSRESIQEADPPEQISCPELLAKVQVARQRAGLEALEVDAFLEARALELEAECQVRTWSERLRARRDAASRLADPGYDRTFKRLGPGEELIAPDRAVAIAIVSTDGRFGVVIYGLPK